MLTQSLRREKQVLLQELRLARTLNPAIKYSDFQGLAEKALLGLMARIDADDGVWLDSSGEVSLWLAGKRLVAAGKLMAGPIANSFLLPKAPAVAA